MINQMMLLAKMFFRKIGVSEEKGQGLIEYALIVLLISIVVILVLQALGVRVNEIFIAIRDRLVIPPAGGGG